MPTPTPIALAEARATGAAHYFTGKPCKAGHISPRSTKKSICLECQRGWQREARRADPAGFAAKSRKKLYGLTEEAYHKMLSDQNGVCCLCDDAFGPKGPHVDHCHCHSTGRIRGLLCSRCNLMLGHARDNAETLTRAIAYLNG